MNIEVRMFMKFRSYLPPGSTNGKAIISLEKGATLEILLNLLGIPIDEPKIMAINGVSHGFSGAVNSSVLKEVLEEGDIVSFFSPSGGG